MGFAQVMIFKRHLNKVTVLLIAHVNGFKNFEERESEGGGLKWVGFSRTMKSRK
jgi:hypothetical protein